MVLLTAARVRRVCGAFVLLAALDGAARADTIVCNSGTLPQQAIRLGGPPGAPSQPDLLIAGPCRVPPGQYYFGDVNIVAGGAMTFDEATYAATHLWASAIIVENGGSMMAGSDAAPFGRLGGTLTIHLYGADQSGGHPDQYPGQGTPCRTRLDAARDIGPCGIPLSLWNSHDQARVANLPGGVAEHFVPYEPLPGDSATGRGPGYFGYKVLGVSYGGTLALFGAKGADYGAAAGADADPTAAGMGWVRLAEGAALDAGATRLTLDRAVQGNWRPGDEAVLTPTDGDPEHIEEITIDGVADAALTFHRTACRGDSKDADCPGLLWPHDAGSDPDSGAAVALLVRSIRIVSEGDAPGQSFDEAAGKDPAYAFGGHTIVRQGFLRWAVRGVEFHRLGQGGKREHYPINFQAVGATPPDTFLRDSVVRDTMTYSYAVRAIPGVAIERVVGYRSTGQSSYLADCTYLASFAYCQP